MKVRILLLVLLPSLILLSTVGIFVLEYDSLFDSFWWTVVTFTTVGYGDFSPASVGGRLFGIVVLVTGVIINSVVITLVSNWYFHFQSAKARGHKPIRSRDHILVCSNDREFISAIIAENPKAHRAGKLVVVSDSEQTPLAATKWRKTPWVHGPGFDRETLSRAGIGRARIAYVSYSNDSETVMTVMQIHNLSGTQTRTLAMVTRADHKWHLDDVGSDYTIDPHDIYVPLMVKASFSPAAPEWIRQVILGAAETPTIENHKVPSRLVGATWADLASDYARDGARGVLPVALVDAAGSVHANPLSDHHIEPNDRLLVLAPPRNRKSASRVPLPCAAPPRGRMLVMSDSAEFISRILRELDAAEVTDEIVVLSEVEPFAYLSERMTYRYRWVHACSYADDGLKLAGAADARIAFIEHDKDSHTLMAVLRLEQVSHQECFAIASYKQPGFDERLRVVGCDFALNTGELVAPILTQTARHYGMGPLVEEIISQSPQSESLFVAPLGREWVTRSWSETVRTVKAEHEHLPVALVRADSDLLVPHPPAAMPVGPGDSLVFLTLTGNGVRSALFDRHAVHAIGTVEQLEAERPEDQQVAARRAHEQATAGNPEGQFHLGVMYERGTGVERNPAQAYKWLHRAARQGHGRAAFKLGTFHFQGFGVDQDRAKAMHFMQLAANQGYVPAQRVLASMRELGRGSSGQHLINHDLLDHLEPHQQAVYLKCMIKMLIIGGDVGVFEQGYFKEAVQMTRSTELIHEIEQAVMFGEELHIPRAHDMTHLEQRLMIVDLVRAALLDHKLTRAERSFLDEAAALIGASPKVVQAEIVHAEAHTERIRNAAEAPVSLHAPR